MFLVPDARSPFDRSLSNGFRCMKYLSAGSHPEALTRPVETLFRDYSKEKPVSDDVFRAYKGFYSYDRTELKPLVESVDESPEQWRVERISYDAAYGNERIPARLFLPKNVAPPFQTVVYFPHSGAFQQRSSENEQMLWVDFIIRSGRALLYPVYKGMFERRVGEGGGPNWYRDMVIYWAKDLGRSIDYLETRKDIDRDRLAYFDFSLTPLPILILEQRRLKVAVSMSGGFGFGRIPPEVDDINFAPRVTIPFLMINGRDDFVYPVDSSQIPKFRLLGTPPQDKRHAILEAGHVLPRTGFIKETLDWLDRYLGPVK
jgi:pimeloyl-ACP methyl ester carboxylesterase